MWINALRITEDAVSLPLATTHLTVFIVPVILDTLVTDLPAKVSEIFI